MPILDPRAPTPSPLHTNPMSATNFPLWFLLQEALLAQPHSRTSAHLPGVSQEGGTFSQIADKLLEGSNQGILFPPFPLATSMGLFVPAPALPPETRSQVVGLGDQHSQLLDAVVNVEPPSPFN